MKERHTRGRISQGQNGDPSQGDFPATLSSPTRHKPLHEVSQLKPHRGRCGADKRKESTATLHIATYNTRTLALQEELEQLQDQLKNFKWDIIGLCETKRKGEGLVELKDGSWLYEAGKTEESPETKGLAFLVHKNIKDYIEDFCKHSDRIISCKIKLQKESLQIIEIYAPTTDYDDTDIEIFYEELENSIDKKCKYTVIIGDFNAKIGRKETDEENEWIGSSGIGKRNERGERLIDFCTANRLYITNSFFEKPASRYWTWESPGGGYKN
ncbi:craniofacial development protein 2 [Elysia marginata]|uniref:Craniofacial development protein 2 n=1 Tax=Elysia marginata TaxID=1093978 RepID=A0AAV4HHG9_9GAST|nr:craniofacial development protein 2 [Elysia marginata]